LQSNSESPKNNGKADKVSLIAASLLFCTTLSWFYIFHSYLLDTILQNTGNEFFISIAKLLFYSFLVLSGLIGSLVSEKVDRRRFLFAWLLLGAFTIITPTFFQGIVFYMLFSILLGISFGLGFPSVQGFLTDSTNFERRGRISGIIVFLFFSIVVAVLLFANFSGLGATELLLVCETLSVLGFLALLVSPCRREKGATLSLVGTLKSRSFASYAVPWLIFNIANGMLAFAKFTSDIEAVRVFGSAIEFLATIIAALVAGFLADRYGRKQPLLIGLVALGVGYALLGLVSSAATYLLYVTVEGAAWGLIVVSYMLVILGDLSSQFGSKEKFYALGGIMIPFLTRTIFVEIQGLTGFTLAGNYLTTMLSIVTFISVIPVLRAPETLPADKISEKKMRDHLKKVSKLLQESKKHK